MIRVFALPDLGEGLTESQIVAWHVAPGDTVTLNQHIADVETAKAVVELPSPYEGVVRTLHQPEGVVVQVGEPIVSFDVVSFDVAEPAGVAPARTANLVGYGAEPERAGRPRRRARPGHEPASLRQPAPAAPPARGERPRSTPPVRLVARELHVDLGQVAGTGPAGLITREDVRRVAAGTAPASEQKAVIDPQGPGGSGLRETRTPIKSLRKLTAAAMVRSAFTAPHVTEFLTVDVTATLDLLESLERTRGRTGGAHRVGILAVTAQALCLAVARTPSVNTRWDDAAGEIVQFHGVNLGIAAATPRGLMVPVIAHADRLSLADLADALAELARAAKAGSTTPQALRGGTITVTNIGVFGVDAGTPILNPGEAAILAMGAIRRRPWEYRGEVMLRSVLTLSLSFDHRLVDGEQGSRFLTDIGRILAEPGQVLTLLPGR
ncbi:MAG: dihydrolipoamide acetyltransferase family protein [Cryobacterium sp.]